MPQTIKLTAKDGSPVEFVNEIKGAGTMKDVYFSPDKSYAVAFYREKIDVNQKARIEEITGKYRERVFNQIGGKYWEDFFCWPTKIVEWEGKVGVVLPIYQSKFFFSSGKFKGKEKNGKWFASAKLMNKFVEPDQKGTFLTHIHMCLKIARAVRRMHAAGLAHSDLSFNNVLVDPITGSASVIDIDTLVVPGKYPSKVFGTPDFIAPEVLETQALPMIDPVTKLTNTQKNLPSRYTDEHALAVLIYMYLLNRHPLRGGKVWDMDPAKDEELSMGKNALFIEHPTDKSNRPKLDPVEDKDLFPQADIVKRPYTICGPYLKPLFEKAFIDGLHNPQIRPTANEWEDALLYTTDMMVPCSNPNCEAHWFVFDNKTAPRCPFCGKEFHGQLPILNLYYSPKPGNFREEKRRITVHDKKSLYMWHVSKNVPANEKTPDEYKKPVGDFHFLNGRWVLINRKLTSLRDLDEDKDIPINSYVELTDGKRILLSKEQGGRLVIVQLVNC